MSSIRVHARLGGVVLGLTFIVVVAGCTSDDPAPAAPRPIGTVVVAQTTTPRGSSLAPDTTVSATPPVEIVGVYEAIGFYPACGNEALDHEGVTWYPLVHSGFDPMDPALQDRVDEVLAVEREDSPVSGVDGFARVPAPGPGDDIGTLVVWADGVARWVSKSRDLDVWMIDDEIVYTWDC
jgi:hypothetical protein